ncbi:hypothetical protein [Limnospira platensis]
MIPSSNFYYIFPKMERQVRIPSQRRSLPTTLLLIPRPSTV